MVRPRKIARSEARRWRVRPAAQVADNAGRPAAAAGRPAERAASRAARPYAEHVFGDTSEQRDVSMDHGARTGGRLGSSLIHQAIAHAGIHELGLLQHLEHVGVLPQQQRVALAGEPAWLPRASSPPVPPLATPSRAPPIARRAASSRIFLGICALDESATPDFLGSCVQAGR